LCACVIQAIAFGDGIIRLVPNLAGPYSGGEAIVVDIFLSNFEPMQFPIVSVRLDYTDSTVLTPATMTWLLNPPESGVPNLPVPTFDPPSATLNLLPADGSILLGRVTITLPRDQDGCFILDVMNPGSTVPNSGARVVVLGATGGLVTWQPENGSLLGGRISFRVGDVGSPELCNGEDDDCDNLIDEGFCQEQFDFETGGIICVGPGGTCVFGIGDCEVPGRLICSKDGTEVICIPGQTQPGPHQEGPVGTPQGSRTCFDLDDNDCDGLVDHEDPDCQGPELCDDFDNDNDGEVDEDFPLLDQSCEVGTGPCKRKGVYICNSRGDGVVCSAEPLAPGVEGPPGSFRCSDGFDNDCDDLIDQKDPDCQTPEVCDGKDNDGDQQIDENFPTLGQSCTVGIGTCERSGVIVCKPNKLGVQCSVTPGAPTPEGPGCDCADGLDNDCDGLIDLDDPHCGAGILRVQAALPRTCSDFEGACLGRHVVHWKTLNAGAGLVEKAEILAMDAGGTIHHSAVVSQSDIVRLTNQAGIAGTDVSSRLFEGSAIFWGARFEPCISGPDVDAGLGCYYLDSDCDNDLDLQDVAWFQQHMGETFQIHEVAAQRPVLRVNADDGIGFGNAYASPVPHIHVWSPEKTVVSLSEGDRIRSEIQLSNIDLSSLELYIDGVKVFDALGLDPATDFPGGPYGGSVPLPNGCTADICELIVDAADSQTQSANTLRMYVENMCCGGHRIVARAAELKGSYPLPPPAACAQPLTNDDGVSFGFEVKVLSPPDNFVDPAHPTSVVGEICHGIELESPTPSADGFVKINAALFPVQLVSHIMGDGVFTADTLRYNFEASLPKTDLFQDMIGNHIPGTLDPGGNFIIAEAMDPLLNTTYDVVPGAVGPLSPNPASAGNTAGGLNAVPHGFSAIATEPALDTIVTAALKPLVANVIQDIANTLNEVRGTKITIPTDACNVGVRLLTDDPVPFKFNADPNDFTFDVTPLNNQLEIVVTSGLIGVAGSAKGSCRINGLFGECFIRVKIKVGITVDIDKIALKVVVTENDLINQNDLTPQLIIDNNDVHINVVDVGSDVECWGGVLAQILSFGQIENIIDVVVQDKLQDFLDGLDVTQYLGLVPVPPIPLNVLSFDPVNIQSLDVDFHFALTEVEITPNGLSAGFETEFVPTQLDDEVQVLPGLPNTIAAMPLPPIPSVQAKELTALISDDAINQLLYALTRNGILKTEFEDTRQLQDLLPANCGTLPPGALGQCEAVKGTSCITLANPTDIAACQTTAFFLSSLNLSATTPIVLHGRLDVPPKFLVFRTAASNEIVVLIRLAQAFAGIVADRGGDGVSGQYDAIPSCISATPPTSTDCTLWSTCFNVNYTGQLTLGMVGGTPRITFALLESDLSVPTSCAGAVSLPGANDAFESIFEGEVFDRIQQYVDDNIPPFDFEELDFDGIITLQDLGAIIFGTAFDVNFEDYFGASCDPVEAP
jgi:hypothetical protein